MMKHNKFCFRKATMKKDERVPDEYIRDMQFQEMGLNLAKELTKHNKFYMEEHNEGEIVYSSYEMIVFHPSEYHKHIQEEREDAIRNDQLLIESMRDELKNVYIYLQERDRRNRWWKGYMKDLSKVMTRIERFIRPM